jgi:aminoglycoside phosphotransferase (APT) family kinase protein
MTDAARRALIACKLDPETPLVRAASYANETWLADDFVLRVNTRGVGRLAREARIVSRLPREARHPGIRDVGDDGELEWSISPRAAGGDLGRAWPAMSNLQRERAIRELCDALAAVHATPTDGIPDDIDPPHTLPLARLLELVELVALEHNQNLDDLAAFIIDRWDAFDDADTGLVHGDPHFENVLWEGEHVSALLDFEWSRGSWIHCDLELLLSIADDPNLFASADYTLSRDAFVEVPQWIRSAQPAWFAHPRLIDRLDVLHASRALGHIVDGHHPIRWQHLRALVDGHPSYRRAL